MSVRFVLAVVGATLVSCAPPESVVDLDVHFDAAWEIDTLRVVVEGPSSEGPPIEGEADVAAAPRLRVFIPEEWNDRALRLRVVGRRGDVPVAAGQVSVVPRSGETVRASVSLSRLPCGAWCTPGASACDEVGVVTCQRQADGCPRWGEPERCPSDAPFCSFGACDADCVDECAEGEQRCAGPGGVEVCGQADEDPCLDWLAVRACGEGTSCSAGLCRGECVDECEPGAWSCRDGGRSRCADRDGDGCAEWGPAEPCTQDETCMGGACIRRDACEDECSADACSPDGTFTVCGNFDLDPCSEPSPGTSCAPADPCFEGRCTSAGCESVPRVCATPPASTCVAPDRLRVFDAVGACEDGVCTYTPRDVDCPNCPACDACVGVRCDSPPNGCFAATGTCTDGACSYEHVNGARCDDGNACTNEDRCQAGVCAGTLRSCATPPPPTCVSASTLRSYASPGNCSGGECVYPHVDLTCPQGCERGACRAAPCRSDPCDPVERCGCEAGEACDVSAAGDFYCRPSGTRREWEACTRAADCAPGLRCGGSFGCARYCYTDADCPDTALCAHQPEYPRVCSRPCTPGTDRGCDSATRCIFTEDVLRPGLYYTLCEARGPRRHKERCPTASNGECGLGTQCVHVGEGEHLCLQVCDVTAPNCARGEECMQPGTIRVDGRLYGFCY